jgi:hypothetical protein
MKGFVSMFVVAMKKIFANSPPILTLPIRCYEEVVESKKEAIRELVAYAGDCEGHRPLHYQPISDK